MSGEATTSGSHPIFIPIRTIITRNPTSNDHDTSHAYGALRKYLRSIEHSERPDAPPPVLRSHFHRLAEAIEDDIMFAAHPLNWMAREGIYDADSEELHTRERSWGGALRCIEALHLFDVLCRFYDELLTQHSQDFLCIFRSIIIIVSGSTSCHQANSIRAKASYTLRARFFALPEAMLDDLYEPYIEAMHSVLQNEKYSREDNDVLHYGILSIANVAKAYPSTALVHLAPLLPELYPILSSRHPTLRDRATQAITGLASAYIFHPTPETSSSSLEQAIIYPLRDWARTEAKSLPKHDGHNFWTKLKESKHIGETWGWRISATLLALLGRRIWRLPGTLKMLTTCVRPGKPNDGALTPSSSASSGNDSEVQTIAGAAAIDRDEGGLTREELTADIYRLLAHSFACMRLFQQEHGESVSFVEKRSQSQRPVSDNSLSLLLGAWPALPFPSTPEPHQPSNPTQSYADSAYSAAASFVPAILCALVPEANEEDRVWNTKAALEIVQRMLRDGAPDGEAMLARLMGTSRDDGDDGEMDRDEGEDQDVAQRETLLKHLLSQRALGNLSAPAEDPVGALDVKALKSRDIVVHWTALVECWGLLLQQSPYSDNTTFVFKALLRSPASLKEKTQLFDSLTKFLVFPPGGDPSAYDLQCRFWDVALRHIGRDVLQPLAQPLLQALLVSPPAATDALSSCAAWICLACMLGAGEAEDAWSAVEVEVARATSISALNTAQALNLAVTLARSAPLRSGPTQSLLFIEQVLNTGYDALRQSISSSEYANLPAFAIFSALQANIASRGISVRSVITLLPGLSAWIGDEQKAVPDDVHNDKIVKLFEVLLIALEPAVDADGQAPPPPSSGTSDPLTLEDLSALVPLFVCVMDRLSQPGYAADALWAFWTRLHARLALKGDDYPYEIQGIISALCTFLGYEVPEGMETQEEGGASQMAGQGTPSIRMPSQAPEHAQEQQPGDSLQTQGQTSSEMYWAAQSSLPSRLLKTQEPASTGVPLPLPVLPSPSQLAGLASRVQASLARREEPKAPPAKRRRLTPEGDDHEIASRNSSSWHRVPLLPKGPSALRRPSDHSADEHLVQSNLSVHQLHTASSSRSRKSHLPTPTPSDGLLSSPIGGPEELVGENSDGGEVVPASEPDEEWDGDEGMIIDEEEEEEDGDKDDGDFVHDATRSIQCARGHEEDVPGVSNGGDGNETRSSLFGRYTYSRREKEDNEIVPATPGADNDSDYSSPAAKFFSSTRKRLMSGTSPILTFNLSYSHAGSPSPREPSVHRPYSAESPSIGAESQLAPFSYSERGSMEILRNLPRGPKPELTRMAASASSAYNGWQDESAGDIPGFGGDDIPGFGLAPTDADDGGRGTEPAGIDRDDSGRFSYSEQGSLEILRNPPRGSGALGLRMNPGSRADSAGSGDIPGLGGDAILGLGAGGIAGPVASRAVPTFEGLVDAINTIEAWVERGGSDERTSGELTRLRGILSRLD